MYPRSAVAARQRHGGAPETPPGLPHDPVIFPAPFSRAGNEELILTSRES